MKRIAAGIAGIVALAALPATGAPPVNAPPFLPVPLPVTAPSPLPVTAPDPLPVLDAENPARSAYVERESLDIPAGFLNGIASFPTPEGRRVVIEYVAVSCSTHSATDTLRVRLSVTKRISPTGLISFAVPVVQMQSEGAVSSVFLWSGAAQVKLYSDAGLSGQGIGIDVFHTDTTVEASCSASVFGYTVGL